VLIEVGTQEVSEGLQRGALKLIRLPDEPADTMILHAALPKIVDQAALADPSFPMKNDQSGILTSKMGSIWVSNRASSSSRPINGVV